MTNIPGDVARARLFFQAGGAPLERLGPAARSVVAGSLVA